MTYSDRVIIGQLTNMSDVGIYSLAYTVGMLLLVLHSAMSLSWEPIFMKRMNDGDLNAINSISFLYAKTVFYFGLFLILFSKPIISILAPSKYHSALDIVPIVVISYIVLFLYEQYSRFLRYYRKTYFNAIFTLIAAAVNIGLNYWLIPIYGYKVAAYTTLVSFVLLCILYYTTTRFFLKVKKVIPFSGFFPGLFLILGIIGVDQFILSDLVYWQSIIIKVLILTGLGYYWFLKDKKDLIMSVLIRR